jgi:hypothetical protein
MTDQTADITRRVELERNEAARQALEAAACKLELITNISEPYRKALKMAARLIRGLKP